MPDIGSSTDLPDFSNNNPPTIDPTEQSKVDLLLTAFYASSAQIDKDEPAVDQDMAALADWSAIAEKVLAIAQPIISGLLTKTAVPVAAHPSLVKSLTTTALPQLIGLATAAPSARAGLFGNLVTSLLPAL